MKVPEAVAHSPMTAARWARLAPLIDGALELPPERRSAYLASVCVNDRALQSDLERLLSECDRGDSLIDRAAAERFALLLEDPPVLPPGALGDRFLIEREIGRGGMATVYLAHDRKHDRPVAVKVLRPELAATVGPERFLREIRTAARLQHPHILPLHDSGEADGVLYYVMPFVQGESLRDRLIRERQLPLDESLRVAGEVADALDYAHRHDVVHRDIKPENILLSDGHALVMDFGIARAVSASGDDTSSFAGIAVGTPAYMSPEQATAERVIDGRADIYALGCVLHEMLTGNPPFIEATARETLARHSFEPVPRIRRTRLDVPEFVDQAVRKSLAKAPADRFASASAFSVALAQVDAGSRKVSPARRWVVFTAAGVVVLLAALTFSRQPVVAGRPPTTADAPPSIAILPFTNVGGLAVNEPFSDGIADELTTALVKFDGVNVLARSSAFSFKAKGLGAREIGRRLHVRYILEGSVRRSAQRWRFNAALVDTTTGTEVWSDRFDLDPLNRDIFTVTDSITRSIVRLLVPHISGAAIASSVRRPTENLAAHELYLQGRYFFEKRDSLGLAKAQAYFERAIETDSMYALAYAGLSDAYGQQSVFGSPARVGFPKAKVYARRALSLDRTLVEAHTSLGFIALFYDWDLRVAGRELATALRLNPRYAPAHLFHAWYYMAVDSVNEGIDEGRRAVQLDPFSSINNTRLVTFLFYGRRYGEALNQANKIIERDSTFVQVRLERAWVYVQLGRCADAMAELARAPDQQLRGVRGYVYAKCERRAEALGELDALRRQAAEGKYVSPYWLAVIQGGLGNNDQALAELERAYTERSWTMFMLRHEPAFEHLHDDARFERLVRRVGLTL